MQQRRIEKQKAISVMQKSKTRLVEKESSKHGDGSGCRAGGKPVIENRVVATMKFDLNKD